MDDDTRQHVELSVMNSEDCEGAPEIIATISSNGFNNCNRSVLSKRDDNNV